MPSTKLSDAEGFTSRQLNIHRSRVVGRAAGRERASQHPSDGRWSCADPVAIVQRKTSRNVVGKENIGCRNGPLVIDGQGEGYIVHQSFYVIASSYKIFFMVRGQMIDV